MWIQELFIDEFDGSDDLSLQRLSNTINVIRVPSDAEAKQLCRFIPGVLYGRVIGNGRPRGGTLIVQQQVDENLEGQFDLSRFGDGTLTTEGSFFIGELQIGGEDSTVAERTMIADGLRLIDADFYLATFTDILPPVQRINTWRGSHWLERWLQPQVREIVETPVAQQELGTTTFAPHGPEPSHVAAEQEEAIAELELTKNRFEDWYQACLERRERLAAETQSATSMATAEATLPAEKTQLRADYLNAQQAIKDLRDQIQNIRNELSELDVHGAAIGRAEALRERQKRLQKKQRSKPSVSGGDIRTVRQLESELTELREQLQAQREADERLARQRNSARIAELQTQQNRIERLLEKWSECQTHQDKIAELRRRMSEVSLREDHRAQRSKHTELLNSEETSWETRQHKPHGDNWTDVEDERVGERTQARTSRDAPAPNAMTQDEATRAIRELQETFDRETRRRREQAKLIAQREQSARRLSPVETSADETLTEAELESAKAESLATDEQMTSLQRQIRQLRDECRWLLSRQLLSRQTLVGVGMLFSAGAAIVLSAIFLDLDGAEVPTGSIGLTCILAALLLKVSFERAPSQRLRDQRLRVAELLYELESLKDRKQLADDLIASNEPEADEASDAPANPATQHDSKKQPSHDFAEGYASPNRPNEWHATLARYDLPLELELPEAITRIRKRIGLKRPVRQAAPPLNPKPQAPPHRAQERNARAEQSELTRQMRHHQDAVTRWCDQALELVPRDRRADTETSSEPNELYAALHSALEKTRRRQAERSVANDATSVTEATESLQSQIKELKQQRARILDRAGVKSLSGLEKKLAHEKAQPQKQRRALKAEIERELELDPQAEQIRSWLKNEADFERLRRQHAAQADELKRRLSKTQTQLQGHETEMERWARQRPTFHPTHLDANAQNTHESAIESLETLDLTEAILRSIAPPQPLAEATSADRATVAAESESSTEVEPETEPVIVPLVRTVTEPSVLVELASHYLAALTDELDLILWESPEAPLAVQNRHGDEIQFEVLSASEQHLVAFALQLAMVREVTESVELPMILRDASLRHTPETCDRLAELLAEFSEDGQQILLITVQTSVTDLFHQLGIPTLVVSRQTVVSQLPDSETNLEVDPLSPKPIDVAVPTSLPFTAKAATPQYAPPHQGVASSHSRGQNSNVREAVDAALAFEEDFAYELD